MSHPSKPTLEMPFKAVILGCGNIAGGYDLRSSPDAVMTHAKAFRANPKIRLVGAFDIDAQKGAEFCKSWDIPTFNSDLESLLAECTPDIVSICTPNETHFEIFEIVAAHRPRAIVCEKPLALELSQAHKMVDRCQREGILLAVNYQRRWDEALCLLTQRILRGDFGNFQLARVLYTKGVFHNASHMINLLQLWAGQCRSASVQKLFQRNHGDLLANFTLQFDYCSEAVFHALNASFYNYAEMDLHFSKARIFMPGAGGEIRIQWAKEFALVPGTMALTGPNESITGTLHKALEQVINNVVNALSEQHPLRMNPTEALKTIDICELVNRKSYE